MTMEAKRLQRKINVVKKKMKRIRIKEKPEFTAENKPTQTIWSWIKEKFW
jgi:hypothetical protein